MPNASSCIIQVVGPNGQIAYLAFADSSTWSTTEDRDAAMRVPSVVAVFLLSDLRARAPEYSFTLKGSPRAPNAEMVNFTPSGPQVVPAPL